MVYTTTINFDAIATRKWHPFAVLHRLRNFKTYVTEVTIERGKYTQFYF